MDPGSFDVVIASHVLEHLEDARAALEDWMRVLRPGGLLIIGVPMHLPPVARLGSRALPPAGVASVVRAHCHFFSMRSLMELLRPYPVAVRIRGFRLISARQVVATGGLSLVLSPEPKSMASVSRVSGRGQRRDSETSRVKTRRFSVLIAPLCMGLLIGCGSGPRRVPVLQLDREIRHPDRAIVDPIASTPMGHR